MCICVGIVSATSIDLQNADDFNNSVTCIVNIDARHSGSCGWIDSPVGGNSYINTYSIYNHGFQNGGTGGYSSFRNKYPLAMTYWAASALRFNGLHGHDWIALKDANLNTLYTFQIMHPDSYTYSPTTDYVFRYEIRMKDNRAYLYLNGTLNQTSTVLSQNPSYVEAGIYAGVETFDYATTDWDDVVYGNTATTILGAPKIGAFQIQKDSINPSSYGFAKTDGTIISAFNMTTTYSFGSETPLPQTILLKNYFTGQVVSSYTTPSGSMTGSVAWPIYDDVINNTLATYGYYVATIAQTNVTSEPILYNSAGATVSWDSNSYTQTDIGRINWNISSTHYNPNTYLYTISITDIYGNVIGNRTLTSRDGSLNVPFDSTNYPQGVYLALLYFTPITGGSSILMAGSQTEITGYVAFFGYVMNAETATTLAGVNVNVTQNNGLSSTIITSSNGSWYSTDPWLLGKSINVSVNHYGYKPTLFNFTPIHARTIPYNISLKPLTPSCNGVCISGIVRDSAFHVPISGSTVSISNTTISFGNTTTTNVAGYYRFDNLINQYWYTLTGSAFGFSSKTVQAEVFGI